MRPRSSSESTAPVRARATLASLLIAALASSAAMAADGVDGVRFSGAAEVRFEHLDDAFRAGTRGADDLLVTRLEARAELTREVADGTLSGAFEIMDARAFLHDAFTPLGTNSVNALEPIEAWLAWESDAGRWRVGRMAQDVGSRRLVARNYYRNTTNTYTGIEYLGSFGAWRMRAFAWSPDERLPGPGPRLRDDDFEFDDSDTDHMLYGVFADTRLSATDRLETWVYHYVEQDDGGTPTANRRITTPGARLLRMPKQGLDLELEVAAQVGTVRASRAPADTRDLDLRAALVHAEVGYRARETAPRMSLALDYASGDDDPNDGRSTTFDGLFGAVVPDFGPSGIWTWLNRRNEVAVSAVVEAPPHDRLRLYGAMRHARLAESRDAWHAAGLRDPSGASGRELGTVFETRLRWWLVPERVLLDTGAIALFKGDFARDAPGAPGGATVTYTWLATRVVF